MKTKNMIARNREIQEQLNQENEAYYEKLVVYVRTKSLLKSEQATEEVLLTIAQDLLSAQIDGVSAEEYFGDDPKAIADDLLKEFPSKLTYGLKWAMWAVLCAIFATSLVEFLNVNKAIDLGSLGLAALWLGGAALLIIYLIGVATYSKISHKIALFLLITTLIGGTLALMILVHTPFTVTLSGYPGIAVITVIFAILITAYIREKDKDAWLPFVPVVLVYCVGGILIRLPVYQAFFSSDAGKKTIAFGLLGTLIVFYGLIFLYGRKLKKDA